MNYEVSIQLLAIENIEADNIKQARERANEIADEISSCDFLIGKIIVRKKKEVSVE